MAKARFRFRNPHPLVVAYTPEEPGKALDIGAGDGSDSKYLADAGYSVDAVDHKKRGMISCSRDVLVHLKRYARQKSLPVSISSRNIRDFLRRRKKRYDLIIAMHSLQFLRKKFPAFAQRLVDSLKPGGRLICAVIVGTINFRTMQTAGTGWNAREFTAFFSPLACKRFEVVEIHDRKGHRGARYPHSHTIFWFVGDKPT